MRTHLPADETNAAGFLPVYQDTRARMTAVFGPRKTEFWPEKADTCSGCYSVTPPVQAH